MNKKPHRGIAQAARMMRRDHPDMPEREIARRLDCNPHSVRSALHSALSGRNEASLRDFQESRAEIYDAVALRAIESISDKKLAKTSAAALSIVAATMHDKAALLRGQATGINVVAFVDAVKMLRDRDRGKVIEGSSDSVSHQAN